MVEEKNDGHIQVEEKLEKEKLFPAVARKYILLNNILYFISKVDTDPILRLCIPKHLHSDSISEYRSDLDHIGIDKTYSAIHSKYTERKKKFSKFFTTLVFVNKSMSQKRFRIEQLCPSMDSMISLVCVHYAIM